MPPCEGKRCGNRLIHTFEDLLPPEPTTDARGAKRTPPTQVKSLDVV